MNPQIKHDKLMMMHTSIPRAQLYYIHRHVTRVDALPSLVSSKCSSHENKKEAADGQIKAKNILWCEMKPVELYLSKNGLEGLQQQAKVGQVGRAQLLLNSMPKLWREAEKVDFEAVDEERAYVLYMKYCNVYQVLVKFKEYQDDPKYFENMLSGKKNFAAALKRLEDLAKSLESRYHAAAMQKEDQRMSKMTLTNGNLRNTSPKKVALKVDSSVMTPKELYSLIQQKATSFFILDCRPTMDYQASRINEPYVLSIPEEVLFAGITGNKLARAIPIESKVQWGKRDKIDKLIYMDWGTTDRIEEKTPLAHLRDAMFKWDASELTYTCKAPILLQGGYENFLHHYPMSVTYPAKGRDLIRNRKNANNGAKNAAFNGALADVQYPSGHLNEAFITTPSPKHHPNINSADDLLKDEVVPKVPDRAFKPAAVLNEARLMDTSSSSSNASSSAQSASATINKTFVEETTLPPKVPDRALKAKALLTNKKSAETVRDVIEAEQDLVEDSVRLEQKELELEDSWEKLRYRREREAEAEMKAELLKKEELLLEEIRKTNEEKLMKEKENEKLRTELDTLKRRIEVKDMREMRKQEEKNAEMEAKRRLKHKEEQQRELQLEVERKRRERKLRMEEQKKRTLEAEKRNKELQQEVRSRQPLKDYDGSLSPPSNGGMMKRVHSTPDISKLDDNAAFVDNKSNAENLIPAPKFDRNIKPSAAFSSPTRHKARVANFQPVWGGGKEGLTGLRNLGNTCYMNSILQCLSNFTLPSQYFIDQIYTRELNTQSETKGEVAAEFSEVVRALWSGHYKIIAPTDFKTVVGKYKKAFREYKQQDAHEFLLSLLDWLNADVNEIRRRVALPEINYANANEIEAAKKAWEIHKKTDKSFIQETFYGQTRSTIFCANCHHRSIKFDIMQGLTLHLPNNPNKKTNLNDCIEDLLKPEEVEYKCEKCKISSRKCKKQLEIVKFPLIFIVHLKRFYEDYSSGCLKKKQNIVDFELKDYNFGRFARACGGKLSEYRRYNLYGVCNHFGTLEGGHYTAYCYSQVYGKWYKYDDQDVTPMNSSSVKTSAAYILFYSAVN